MGDVLKVIGPVFWVIGGWLIYVGITMTVTVNPDGAGEVANLQLMHIQQLDMLIGALAVIQGTICFVGGLMLDRKSAQV